MEEKLKSHIVQYAGDKATAYYNFLTKCKLEYTIKELSYKFEHFNYQNLKKIHDADIKILAEQLQIKYNITKEASLYAITSYTEEYINSYNHRLSQLLKDIYNKLSTEQKDDISQNMN